MKKENLKIDSILAVLWGKKSEKIFIAVHGNMSDKEDKVIKLLADRAVSEDYQVISFDLPEHGDRKDDTKYLCKVQNCVSDLKRIISYAKNQYKEINLFACSMGAYFSLSAYKNDAISQCLFLSPIVNMEKLITNMMLWSNVTEEELKLKQEIKTDFGQTLYWDYYLYVKNNPLKNWNKETFILYGNKDEIQEEAIIKKFASENKCGLDILENGEHYFHTEEQLNYYMKWLENKLI